MLQPGKAKGVFSLLLHEARAEEGTEMGMVKEEESAAGEKPLSTANLLLSPCSQFVAGAFSPSVATAFSSQQHCRDSWKHGTSFGGEETQAELSREAQAHEPAPSTTHTPGQEAAPAALLKHQLKRWNIYFSYFRPCFSLAAYPGAGPPGTQEFNTNN